MHSPFRERREPIHGGSGKNILFLTVPTGTYMHESPRSLAVVAVHEDRTLWSGSPRDRIHVTAYSFFTNRTTGNERSLVTHMPLAGPWPAGIAGPEPPWTDSRRVRTGACAAQGAGHHTPNTVREECGTHRPPPPKPNKVREECGTHRPLPPKPNKVREECGPQASAIETQ